jgi:hypothetical protein
MENVQIMNTWSKALRRAIPIAALTSITTALAAMFCGWRENHNAVAPLNAISHIAWGEEAARQEQASAKYTATGLALNTSAMFGWAFIFARLVGGKSSNRVVSSLGGGIFVSLLAYVVDYHVVPKRLTPGVEDRLSSRSLLVLYVVLALSLALAGFVTRDTTQDDSAA